jgi:hypothetical protein
VLPDGSVILQHSIDKARGGPGSLSQWRDGTKKHDSDKSKGMEYRGVEYTVVQGIKLGVWKWTASVANLLIMGQASTKPAAVAAAPPAVNKALAPTKVRLVPPERGD